MQESGQRPPLNHLRERAQTHEVNDDATDSRIPRRIGLEPREVREGFAVDTLPLGTGVEAKVRHTDAEPAHQAGYGGHVDEPVENATSTAADGHVCKQTEETVDAKCDPRETPAVDAREDPGRVAVDGETVCAASSQLGKRVMDRAL